MKFKLLADFIFHKIHSPRRPRHPLQTDAATISASELVDASSISAFEAVVVASYFVWCLRLSSQRNFSVAVAPTHVTAAYHRSTCPTAPLKSSPPFVIPGVFLSVAAIASVRPCHPSLLDYELDGVDWTKVKFEDNQVCLDLFEKVLTHRVRFLLGRDAQGMAMRTHRLLWCVRLGSGFGLQAFLCDLLVPRTLFSHFRSELCPIKPEILERTHKGTVRNGKQFKT
ncbi:hypothetical protein PIB30_077310 [Stylosanthes scabra]|uniref:Uncharacterized protein n=1 Tax=Stylosanthes scabra TaxID=79078 RepID=A0ABU6XQA1_9FABA|nr:hypothetical protein [Stylosanthes scabra]